MNFCRSGFKNRKFWNVNVLQDEIQLLHKTMLNIHTYNEAQDYGDNLFQRLPLRQYFAQNPTFSRLYCIPMEQTYISDKYYLPFSWKDSFVFKEKKDSWERSQNGEQVILEVKK